MKRMIVFTILCCVCAGPLPIAAQTAAPEGTVLVPAGNFWMGRADAFTQDGLDVVPRAKMDDRPASNVYLDAFYIDKYEVTNADYARFLQAAGAQPPWHWFQGKIPDGEEKLPVSNVNWYEATAYCKWARKRLPTEAEWEKAVRGGRDRHHFSWGERGSGAFGAPIPAAVGRNKPAPVGSFPPNGYGIYDMIGNVLEWTNDWYDQNYYAFMPKQNPRGPESGLYKSIRGGGWGDAGGASDRVSNWYRNFTDPELRTTTIGIRCAKDPDIAGSLARAAVPSRNRPYDQLMKDIGATFANLKKNLDANNAPAAVEDAAKLEGLFKETEAFWTALGTNDALNFAKGGRDAAAAAGAAAKSDDIKKAQASYADIQRSCGGCHGAHREDTGRGYLIKP